MLWLSDRATAEATCGHISTWDTEVTDMLELFCADVYYCATFTSGKASFNEDIVL